MAAAATSGGVAECTDARVPLGVKSEAIRRVSSHRGPVMGPADLQRYKKMLLEKRRELSSAQGDARALVPAAGGWEGDVIDQANAEVSGRSNWLGEGFFRSVGRAGIAGLFT